MKKAIALSLLFLALSVPSFAQNEGGFVKDEKFCWEIAKVIRDCFDTGVKKGCEMMPFLISAIKDGFAKKYNNPMLQSLLGVYGNLCITTCAEGEKYRDQIRSQNFDEYRDFILAIAYNACMCDCKKK